ncbi:MAG: glucokinase [Psychrobium sp.]
MVNLIADVGGTNIRLAAIDNGEITQLECFKCAEFDSLESVVAHYVEKNSLTVNDACFGIAGPVVGEVLTMTNLGWSFSKESVEKALGFNQVHFINDYTAIAMSLASLNEQQLTTIHKGEYQEAAPRIVCGPGTGLGVAQLINVNGYYHCVSGEGGHADFAPTNSRQLKLLENLMAKFEHVSIERLLSGQGIVNIYQSLAFIDGIDAQAFDASQISQAYIKKSDLLCVETMEIFSDVLAQYLGNMVLTSGAFGGVYIAGGIMPRIIDVLDKKAFTHAFSSKGRFSDYALKAPIHLITEPQPGLIGAQVYLSQQQGNL